MSSSGRTLLWEGGNVTNMPNIRSEYFIVLTFDIDSYLIDQVSILICLYLGHYLMDYWSLGLEMCPDLSASFLCVICTDQCWDQFVGIIKLPDKRCQLIRRPSLLVPGINIWDAVARVILVSRRGSESISATLVAIYWTIKWFEHVIIVPKDASCKPGSHHIIWWSMPRV